jgi:hypothetical protein
VFGDVLIKSPSLEKPSTQNDTNSALKASVLKIRKCATSVSNRVSLVSKGDPG